MELTRSDVSGTDRMLEMRGIRKSFPGVHALKGIDLSLGTGEVVALLGENGAGKSTLIKILAGAQRADAGTIRVDGRELQIRSPHDAQAAGIAVMYQEFNLVPGLSAVENIFLGRERATFGFIHRNDECRRAMELFSRLRIEIDPDTPVRRLTIAQQQVVEIAKALSQDARMLIMDEPSAALTNQEVDRLFEIIQELRADGMGLIYISHRLDEIDRIANRIVVLRDGALVGERMVGNVTRAELIELMVGRTLDQEFPPRNATIGDVRLQIDGLTRGTAVRNVSFSVRRGEILGLTGLIGAGRSELARLIFGADRIDHGRMELDGRPITIRSPREAIRHRICLLTEDRKSEGLVIQHSVRENFGLPNLRDWSTLGVINQRGERDAFGAYVEQLSIRIPHFDQLARNLSGGNQQKVVLAKWLQRSCDVIIFDEPTRGIDVGARFEIYQLMNRLADQGKAIIMISSELQEVLGMSDRILVMHAGEIAGELRDVEKSTQEDIMLLAVSGHAEAVDVK